MYTRCNSGQHKKQIDENPLRSYEFLTKEIKKVRHGIPKPVKKEKEESSFSRTTNIEIHNNYFIKTIPIHNIPTNTKANDRYKIEEISINDLDENYNYLAESFPISQTERHYYNDKVIVYKKKFSKDKTYNNNTVHYVKQFNNNTINNNINNIISNERVIDNNYNTINKYNNITSNEKVIDNNYNTINKYNNITSNERVIDNNYNTINKYNNITFKVSREDTSKNNQNKRLYVNHSSKNLNFHIINKDLDTRQKKLNEEINNKEKDEKTTNSKNNNYKMTDIKQKSKKANLNMTTPDNTSIHTIIYTNRKNDKNREVPTPQNLFPITEVKSNTTRTIYPKERNIPEEINNYFYKNKISYKDRSKYINAALLIQISYRNWKKNGKLKFNFIKKYVKFYKATNSIQSLFSNKNRYSKHFINKLNSYEAKNKNNVKKNLFNQIPINRNNHINNNYKITKITKNDNKESKPKQMVRSQSRDVLNVEKLIKEKEDLEKRLNQIMEENNMLKKVNLTNKKLINLNLELTQKLDKTAKKTEKLELEKEKFLNEFSKTKDKYSKIENEVADVNAKLKTTYLKFLLEKKEKKEKQILNKYFKRFKENSQKTKLLKDKKSKDELNNSKKVEKEIEKN